jgi:hypothetical protein
MEVLPRFCRRLAQAWAAVCVGGCFSGALFPP